MLFSLFHFARAHNILDLLRDLTIWRNVLQKKLEARRCHGDQYHGSWTMASVASTEDDLCTRSFAKQA